MTDLHLAYLNLGSNIEPDRHLARAVELLCEYGGVYAVSNAWESESVGSDSPNYLNACVLFATEHMHLELKENIIRPIEAQLGRKRGLDKFAPRTIDIDIILFDDIPYNNSFWKFAFVLIPLAEIHPKYVPPLVNENIQVTAERMRSETWIQPRPEVLGRFR